MHMLNELQEEFVHGLQVFRYFVFRHDTEELRFQDFCVSSSAVRSLLTSAAFLEAAISGPLPPGIRAGN